jgi:hypothetical protein
VSELVAAGAQLDVPLLAVGLRSPLLLPPCLAGGSTALHMAAATGRASLVTVLLHAQQQRHPGLELRRMRNARGMTPLNVALICGFTNLASLLAAGAPVPPPPGAARPRQLPPLLRQQLLALVHRAALLSQLRELGLGARGAAAPPHLPPAPVARLEALLQSDSATPSQVLAAVDQLLEDAAAAAAGDRGRGDGGARGERGGGEGRGGRGGRRRHRRQQQERERVQRQLAGAQAGADWTMLERGRPMQQHAGSLYRRLHRRQERSTPPSSGRGGAAAEADPRAAQEGAVLLADALLRREQAQQAQQQRREASPPPPQQHASRPSTPRQQPGSSSSSSSAGSGGSGGSSPGKPSALAAAAAASGSAAAEEATCPVCLDLPAGISLAPCAHRACLDCCGRLASYTHASGSFGLPLQSPLCPLCRAQIEGFQLATPS